MDLYHDGHEGDVQQHFDETWDGKHIFEPGCHHSIVNYAHIVQKKERRGQKYSSFSFNFSFAAEYSTCEELSVEHIDGLVVPGILTLQVNSVQNVLDEGRQHHGQQNGILRNTERRFPTENTCVPAVD